MSGSASPVAFAVAVTLLLTLQFGPLVGLLGFVLTGHAQWAVVGVLRDAVGALLLLLAVQAWLRQTRRPRWPASVRLALGLSVVFALMGLVADSELLVLALNLRRLVFLPLLFVALWMIDWSPRQLQTLLRLLVTSTLAVALLTLAERAAPESLWTRALDIEAYKSANPFDRFGNLPYHDSGRFFTWDFERWTGEPLRRAIGPYLEPTTLAAGLTAGLLALLGERARALRTGQPAYGTLAGALVLAAAVLTFAKSFLLFVPVLLAWWLLGWPSPRQVLWLTLVGVAIALGASAAGWVDGPLAHVEGLASAARYLAQGHWLGEGIGDAGNYTLADTDVGAESGLGNAIAQVGVAALLPLLWVRALAREVLERAEAESDPAGRWLAAWALFWLVAYLFSASSLGVGGNAIGFVLLALYLHPGRWPWWTARAAA